MNVVSFPVNGLDHLVLRAQRILEMIHRDESEEEITGQWNAFKQVAFESIFNLLTPMFGYTRVPKTYKVKNGKEKITYFDYEGIIISTIKLTETPYQRAIVTYSKDRVFRYLYLVGTRKDNWRAEIRNQTSNPLDLFSFDVVLEGVIENFVNVYVATDEEEDRAVELAEQLMKIRELAREIVDGIGGDEGVGGARDPVPDAVQEKADNAPQQEAWLPVNILVHQEDCAPVMVKCHNGIISGLLSKSETSAEIEVSALGTMTQDDLLAHGKMILEMIAAHSLQAGASPDEVKEQLEITVLEALTDALVKTTLQRTTDKQVRSELEALLRRHE